MMNTKDQLAIIEHTVAAVVNGDPHSCMKGLALHVAGGGPTSFTVVFTNEVYELDVVYYPQQDSYKVVVSKRNKPIENAKRSSLVKVDALQNTIRETINNYFG